jgi:hypothetical protein
LQQLREQAPFGGAQLSPAVIKALLSESADTLLAEGWNLLAHAGVPPAQVQFYEQLIPSIRQAVTLWSPADLFELEHRTALAGFGDRLALRQVLEAAARFEAELPALSPPQPPHSREVSTRFFEEDAYPVGGFSSISTRGSLESLLHSQLAYMDRAERPDLFDIKFLRDELLYYARDENDFLRRRRTFFFVLSPDLSRARIKDAEVPWQRMILALAFVLAAIRTLTKWLSQEALNFEIVFLEEPNSPPLASEKKLFEILLREECAHGLVRVDSIAREQLAARAALHSQRSQCHQLVLSTAEPEPNSASAMAMFLTLHDPRPKLAPQPAARERPADETLWDAWRVALEELLVGWL